MLYPKNGKHLSKIIHLRAVQFADFLRCSWALNYRKNMRKNLWELLDASVLHIFEISAKFRFF
jgi:hypothetical protein